ncbi:MAG: DNA cytosine methyltransferase [Dactylosporangium sp.]|nr:DNA cytosine methyltransferase [Dactylosporangium sp.]NNJ63534.1 DNA cytosine methyltransferase [Dactylosporangium sp.]
MSLTFTDLFCGAGGSSLGLATAGFDLTLAANHWARAIDTHAANFPTAEHWCADVNQIDMRRLPRTDVLWASPICTEISPAGGRRRRPGTRGQLELFDHGPIDPGAFDRTRATAFDVIRATEVHRYTAVLIENVIEFATDWQLFDWWLAGMVQLGYHHQIVCVSSAHIGDDTNPHAPQWRDRLYIVFTRTGIPLPDLAPRPVAWCATCDTLVYAAQSWKDPRKPRIGKYRQQYVYRCPNTTCRHTVLEPYVAPAATAIDWTDIGKRIGDRTRPLAEATLRRIRAGLDTFAQPTVVNTHHTDDRTFPAARAPLPSRTTTIGDAITCPPLLVPAGGTWNTTAVPVDQPMRTRTVRETEGVLTAPPGAFFVKNYTPRGNPAQMAKDPTTQPLGTVTGSDHHALIVPYRRGTRPAPATQPLHTLHTRDSAALIATADTINDCHFRMLKPREHLRAQRFPDTYTVTGNKGEQTMQAGNAVSANVAQWLGHQLLTALDQPGTP